MRMATLEIRTASRVTVWERRADGPRGAALEVLDARRSVESDPETVEWVPWARDRYLSRAGGALFFGGLCVTEPHPELSEGMTLADACAALSESDGLELVALNGSEVWSLAAHLAALADSAEGAASDGEQDALTRPDSEYEDEE